MMITSEHNQLSSMIDCTRQTSSMNYSHTDPTQSIEMTTKHRGKRKFIARNSMITDLYHISHFRCIRNIFVVAFIILGIRGMITDIVLYGRLNWTFQLLSITIGKLHIVVLIWLIMTLSTTLLIYYATHTWASHRKAADSHLKTYDIIWLLAYAFYLIMGLILPCWVIFQHQLPLVSSVIVLGEQVRQLMKTHSYVRESVCKHLRQKSQTLIDEHESGSFRQYMYFLYAPTLIYRDIYPRTLAIQWNFVWAMFGQFLATMLAGYYIMANFCVPILERLFINDITLPLVVTALFDLMLPNIFLLLLGFYGFFHCWLNAFAEMLRFADRMFYLDWWNSTSVASFARTWNLVTHDWLFVYIYQDINRLLHGRRLVATVSVVLISAIIHEYVIWASLKAFYPIITGWFFGFGILLRFIFPHAQGSKWNIVQLTLLPVYLTGIPCVYAMAMSAQHSSHIQRTTGR